MHTELSTKWNKLTNQITSISDTISKIEVSAEIIPLAEKINILNHSLESLTIETMNELFNIDETNPLVCKYCHCRKNLIEGSLSCENPTCILNQ